MDETLVTMVYKLTEDSDNGRNKLTLDFAFFAGFVAEVIFLIMRFFGILSQHTKIFKERRVTDNHEFHRPVVNYCGDKGLIVY